MHGKEKNNKSKGNGKDGAQALKSRGNKKQIVISLKSDNHGLIALIHTPIFYSRIKYINIQYYNIQDNVVT